MLLDYVISLTKWKYPDVVNMTTKELAERLKSSPESVLLIDCREEDEYKVSHLSNAHWLHFQSEEKEIHDGLTKLKIDPHNQDKDIVCYCAVGYRSSILIAKMMELYPNGKFYNLEGSIFRWASEGRPLVDSKDEDTYEVDPVHPLWGWLLMTPPERPIPSNKDQTKETE